MYRYLDIKVLHTNTETVKAAFGKLQPVFF